MKKILIINDARCANLYVLSELYGFTWLLNVPVDYTITYVLEKPE